MTRVGFDDPAMWSDEEIRRGKRLNAQGKFVAIRDKDVMRAAHQELVRRQLSTANTVLQADLYSAVVLLGNIVRDRGADTGHRIQAAKYIIERVMGREPVQVNVSVKAKWEEALESSIVSISNTDGMVEAFATEAEDDDPFR